MKYELSVRLGTLKNGPVLRNRLRLPHPVKTDIRICVIAEPGSKAANEARAAGAMLIGEDEIFNQVKEGIVEFDRCICHVDSLQKMNKAGLGRILGPKGLMPSTKTGTVVTQVGNTVRDMVGGSEYREKVGVLRIAIGQLGFTPEEVQNNIKAFMDAIKKDISGMSSRIHKDIHEVVCHVASHFKSILLTVAGSERYKLAGLHIKRRIQRREFNTTKSAIRSVVGCVHIDVQKLYHIVSKLNAVAMLDIVRKDRIHRAFRDLSTFTASADSSMSA